MHIVPVDDTNLEPVVRFVVEHNMDPAHHIGYLGATPEEIEHEVRSLVSSGVPFAAASQDNCVIGVLGLDSDVEIGRAWLNGPIVTGQEWRLLADRLYESLEAGLPPAVTEREMFVDAENAWCLDFAERHGFSLYGDWHILCFSRQQLASLPAPTAVAISPEFHSVVAALHNRLFPTAHLSGDQIIENLGPHATTLVKVENGELQGYTYVTIEPETGEAYIDFVGVAEHARGRGLGRQLLGAAIHWLFGWPGVSQVSLSVKTDNDVAIRLYERAGFVRERTLRAYRKQVA